jgi:adenosine deaminase/adenosine deaminase CECR1
MRIFQGSLLIALLLAGSAHAASPKANAATNTALTARHYAALIAGQSPQMAELTMFLSQMPKGADLHHHYSGSVYAEQYIDFVDRQGYCVNKLTYRIETDKAVIAAQKALAPAERNCLSGGEVLADDHTYREVLKRWSNKDFDSHVALLPPPDRHFFQTFGFFGPVSNDNFNEGLLELKKRAIEENVGYIETMFKLAPMSVNAAFDAEMRRQGASDVELERTMRGWMSVLEQDPGFQNSVSAYVDKVAAAHANVDDERFTMRYQAYVLRLLAPSMVFSSMVSGFQAAERSELIVGVNIVGQESMYVAMNDYTLHMKMFKFLKARYPNVKVALHAGELALGDVPPEGLKFHIDQAINVAGADRIGHGLDLAHESNAIKIMNIMRERDIPVEVNLTSNAFISGIRDEHHPITLYRRYGVPYVISTDDAGVTRHNLSREYVLFASRYKPAYAEIKRASYNAVRYGFLPEPQKKRLISQLDRRYAAFEADIAKLAASQNQRTKSR